MIRQRIEEMTVSITSAYGAEAKIDYVMGYPPLVNHDGEVQRFFEVAPAALGESVEVIRMEKLMPAEDFAYYVKEIQAVLCLWVLEIRIKRLTIHIIIANLILTKMPCCTE